jgi:cellulose synthase/poly-beta-1,6-N-acetylglucosamine synthase-like glycosyltransferase
MPSLGRIILACVLPVSLLLGALIPATRPLDRVFFPLQALYVGLFVYHLCLVLFGLHTPTPVPPGQGRTRFAVLIPAHNEEGVIGQLLTSLRAQDYPREHYTPYVTAGLSSASRIAPLGSWQRRM